jgi:hypothetical protein
LNYVTIIVYMRYVKLSSQFLVYTVLFTKAVRYNDYATVVTVVVIPNNNSLIQLNNGISQNYVLVEKIL